MQCICQFKCVENVTCSPVCICGVVTPVTLAGALKLHPCLGISLTAPVMAGERMRGMGGADTAFTTPELREALRRDTMLPAINRNEEPPDDALSEAAERYPHSAV